MAKSSTDKQVQMQQQLYERFCQLCQGLLSSVAGKGRHFTVRHHRGRPLPGNRVCSTHLQELLQSFGLNSKEDEVLVQAKEVCGFLEAGRQFFTEGKHCRIPVSSRIAQCSPSTSSTDRNKLTSSTQLQTLRCAHILTTELSPCAQFLAQPNQCTDSSTQTTATVSLSQPVKKDVPVSANTMVR